MRNVIKNEPSPTIQKLSSTNLIREGYRALINNNRTYASFTRRDQELANSLVKYGEIFDPMSGYGGLARFCSENNVGSYGIEYNYPQYLWQVLMRPNTSKEFVACIDHLLKEKKRWPHLPEKAVVSESWFPKPSRRILKELYHRILRSTVDTFGESKENQENSLSMLLPFVSRLSCFVAGANSAHTKEGGICVYWGWEEDFELYLSCIRKNLIELSSQPAGKKHFIFHGDARSVVLPKNRFSAMLTSPPYPNHRDFSSIFILEIGFLEWFSLEIGLPYFNKLSPTNIIGSNFVSGKKIIKSELAVVRKFIKSIVTLKQKKQAEYDDKIYYIPYLEMYFSDLQKAYRNISISLKNDFIGFIVVVNNTHRKRIVPVAESIIEMWQTLKFKAEIFDQYEQHHVGTMNPSAKGVSAKHTLYVIKVSK